MKNLSYYLVFVIFCIFLYGIFQSEKISQENINTEGIIIQQMTNPKRSIAKYWKVVYFVNDEPYFANVTGNYEIGNIIKVMYDPGNLSRHIVEHEVIGYSYESESMFIGEGYPDEIKNKKIRVYFKNDLIREFSFNEKFAFYVNHDTIYNIQFLITDKIHHKYTFDFSQYKENKFQAIQLDYSKNKKNKRIVYKTKNDYSVYNEPLW
ncbi:MAG: hypothetical protein PHQ74_05635 [Crocinitomicaceae bacterium]|nr:hypothetical protein [Crocinitomicaceae bacterium]